MHKTALYNFSFSSVCKHFPVSACLVRGISDWVQAVLPKTWLKYLILCRRYSKWLWSNRLCSRGELDQILRDGGARWIQFNWVSNTTDSYSYVSVKWGGFGQQLAEKCGFKNTITLLTVTVESNFGCWRRDFALMIRNKDFFVPETCFNEVETSWRGMYSCLLP